ncbi:expressed unknown protein [Seminavis robusta]|uniref:Uncharacterized protein n=1 Tax=Seminavis robusta TaxID=568900 RepID=A0A9N8E8I5_9STRA|nr:expressed unknown protein [Seminavis robusta]|eukprot:Sro788_g202550.1 n/a (135) ;mRNA; f:27055-27459
MKLSIFQPNDSSRRPSDSSRRPIRRSLSSDPASQAVMLEELGAPALSSSSDHGSPDKPKTRKSYVKRASLKRSSSSSSSKDPAAAGMDDFELQFMQHLCSTEGSQDIRAAMQVFAVHDKAPQKRMIRSSLKHKK